MYFLKSLYNVSQPEKEKTHNIKSKVRSVHAFTWTHTQDIYCSCHLGILSNILLVSSL